MFAALPVNHVATCGRSGLRSRVCAGPDGASVGPGAQPEGRAPCPDVGAGVRTLWRWGPPGRGPCMTPRAAGWAQAPTPASGSRAHARRSVSLLNFTSFGNRMRVGYYNHWSLTCINFEVFKGVKLQKKSSCPAVPVNHVIRFQLRHGASMFPYDVLIF